MFCLVINPGPAVEFCPKSDILFFKLFRFVSMELMLDDNVDKPAKN